MFSPTPAFQGPFSDPQLRFRLGTALVVELNGDLITAYPVDRYRMPGNRV